MADPLSWTEPDRYLGYFVSAVFGFVGVVLLLMGSVWQGTALLCLVIVWALVTYCLVTRRKCPNCGGLPGNPEFQFCPWCGFDIQKWKNQRKGNR